MEERDKRLRKRDKYTLCLVSWWLSPHKTTRLSGSGRQCFTSGGHVAETGSGGGPRKKISHRKRWMSGSAGSCCISLAISGLRITRLRSPFLIAVS